ncbi:MAG: S8 family serine peptidase [Ferruginibacter sp.]
MKPGGRIFLFIISLFLSSVLLAQQPEQAVLFSNGRFITGNNISKQIFRKENISTASFGKQYFVVVQFSILPSRVVQENLKQAGIVLYTYLPGKAYTAAINEDFNFALARAFNISSINAIPPFYKIDPALVKYETSGNKQNAKQIAISYFHAVDRTIVLQQLQKAGATITTTKYDKDDLIFIQAGKSAIEAIAALPFISEIHLQSITDKVLNYNDVAVHGISGLNALNGKNLNGKGVTIGIGDNADISTHIDFSQRLINRSPWIPASHGTHVAGTAAGAGIINIKNHGMAPKAILINQYFSDIITNAPAYITDNNMVLTNNSYYSAEDGCPGTGEYDILSNYIDRQMGKYSQLLHVIAAGNDGANTCSPYPASYGTVKSGWQSAKNVLTVGAMNTDDYSIAFFSSRGPLKDGRIKPEITAGGWAVTSTTINNTYGVIFGTSMACPVATGSLALMYERYRQIHGGANPKSPLMKVLLCNTAEDLGNPGPDFTFGFGMLNARLAIDAIENNRYFINTVSNGGNTAHTITVPANTRQLKVMLYWADTAAATNAAIALVNDLDLTVTGPAAVLHQPLILNPSPANVNDLAVEGIDKVNNIEQVVVENPVAGTYTIHINGFAVPFGSQEYVISYEMVQPSVTVEYPFGGEKLVPGESEIIRWSAYGNEGNNFKIEYSVNNGINWTTIDNNVASASRKFSWLIPAGLNTNQALIRVSRNGTLSADQSNFNFTILGSPVVTAVNVCEGAIQLDWGSVAGATSYDILGLTGDSMKVIGNTTNISWLGKGLNRNSIAWLGVAAKNGTVAGRRSISVSTLPNTGACTLATFNNDLTVDSILDPTSARQGFANAGNAIKAVKILIRNLGTVGVGGPFNVSYRYANTTVTETINPIIAAGGSYQYTFTGAYTIVPAGFNYDFKSWVSLTSDSNHLNDTAYKTVKYINNDAITVLPVTEGFESFPIAEFTNPEMAIGDSKRLDFSPSSERGRARSFVNTGFAFNGTRAMTLDQRPQNDTTTTDSLTVSYNLSNYISKQLRLDFYYKNHGQSDAPGNKVWVRGSENGVWLQAYDLFVNQPATGNWKRAVININEVLGNSVPSQNVSNTFQVRIGQEGKTSANSASAVTDIDDGYTFDDLTVNEVLNDLGITKIISPDISGCSLGSANPISIQIKNYNSAALINFPVSYQVNGGVVVTENIPSIAPNQTLNYVFNQTANLSAYIDYNINVWVKYSTDSYSANDSILNFRIHNSPVINSYPYLQNFEINDGFFYSKGTNSSWQWGAPAKNVINKAASGTKAWVTNLAGNYNDNETSYLYSPCFDIHGLVQPVLSFSHILITEQDYDYSWAEYSTNGVVWQKLGDVGSGTNWYDDASLINWAGANTRWHVASIDLPVSSSNIRFRFVLSSDAGVTEEGIGIDDIHVFEKATIYTGSPLTGITQGVNSNSWVNFSSGGDRIVSLNSNGTDLGATTIQVHPYPGPVRGSNNQYYANRNIVVRTSKPPSGNVGVRFYFTEAEAQGLVNATGCNSCSKPSDAYELGITKYSGKAGDENGVLEDDSTGFFQFILPASTIIVPYDNGYYAEFSVKSFSEFWLSGATIKTGASGVCPGETIVFTAPSGGINYQWQENNGSGYANISDGPRYSGTNTAIVQLINLPAAFSGYKYRCIRDGVNSNENAVRYTNVWNGNTSSNWFVATNWSCGMVPDQYTSVIIPAGIINYPLVNANTAVRSINVHPGANINVGSLVKIQINGR